MKIAIVTGATGGLGREFVSALMKESVESIWCIARNEAALKELSDVHGGVIRPLALDLSKAGSISKISELLKSEKPDVRFLINNAGIAKAGRYDEIDDDTVNAYIDLNVKSVVLLTQAVLPYMSRGGVIINMSSQSSFQPLPYINLYASGKAFVRSFSRSLNRELKTRGITVTACCPGWVDTKMLPKEINGVKIRYPGLSDPAAVVRKAIRDAKRGRDMSVYSLFVKTQHLYAKLMPQKWSMDFWLWYNRRLLKRYK